MNSLDEIINRISSYIPEIESDLADANKRSLGSKKFSTPGSRLYLRGQYIDFDEESQSLVVRVDGERNYYSLQYYYGEKLPFPGAPVLLFSEGVDGGVRIVGFDNKGKKIPSPDFFEFTIKGVNFRAGELVIKSNREGLLKISSPIEVLSELNSRIGEVIFFKRIRYLPKYYLVPVFHGDNRVNRLKIFEIAR